IIVVSVLVTGGAMTFFLKLPTVFATKPVIPTVRAEKVISANLIEIVSAPGEVQARTKVTISAKVAAPIVELALNEGDFVEENQVIVRLDAKDLQAAVKAAKARLAVQTAQIAVSTQRILASAETI